MKISKGMQAISLRRALLAVAIIAPSVSFAATQAGTVLVASPGAKAIAADGTVRDLVRRAPVFAGERLVTGAGARVQVKFTDGSVIALKPNTELSVDQYAYEPKGAQAMFMSLARGGFRTMTGAIGKLNHRDYRLSTPVATIGVRGTLHEGDFNPETGLALGVWDGGTETCNSNGCLNLGTGADFRFGFVGLDGRQEGRLTPPEGIGEGESIGDRDSARGRDDEAADDSGREERELADDDRGLFVSDPDDLFDDSRRSKFTGFAALGAPRGGATQYPWGSAALIDIKEADLDVDNSEGIYIQSWSLESTRAGGFINPGNSRVGSFPPPTPDFRATTDQSDAWLVWGYWNGVDLGLGYGDVSIGEGPGDVTDVGIPAAGIYAFGSTVSPLVLANLSGELTFNLFHQPDLPYASFPQFFDASSSFRQYASAAHGEMLIDVATLGVNGTLDFTSSQNGDSWHLVMDGHFTSRRYLDLNVVTGSDGSTTAGSWYMPADGSAGSELAVAGSVDAEFVGSATALGILGGFQLHTVSALDSNYANGLFFMDLLGPLQKPAYSGFAALGGASGNYAWGNAPLLVLDNAKLVFGTVDSEEVVLYGSMYSSTLGGRYILPGRLNADLRSVTFPTEDPLFTVLPSDSLTRIAWGQWNGNDMSLADADDGLFTTEAIVDPGAFIFGDWASPAAIANLVGTVGFSLLPEFPVFVDAAGVPQQASNPSGSMTVDVSAGTVAGAMAFTTSTSDQWSLVFDGTFSALSAQQLSLNVVGDAVSPANGSHFVSSAGAGGPLEVGGTIQAAFVGKNDVAGLVGAFDVQTVDTGDTNFARGVFGMTQVPPQPLD